ncbi:hypothetical protein HaLaN_13305 [Haematococcus lacustris]|uniref:Uncharacterized protein n=1 Tax=Haematococcus lacustris TaxID=44745 RepID=A0A699ZCR8_HAELA|nr:hypothetical protein HaLaN_13305 [Haematococcus lacustris]
MQQPGSHTALVRLAGGGVLGPGSGAAGCVAAALVLANASSAKEDHQAAHRPVSLATQAAYHKGLASECWTCVKAAGIVPGAAGPSSHSALLEAATGGGKLLIKALPVRKQAQQVAAPGGSSTSPGAGEANAAPRAGAVTAAAASKQDGLQTAVQPASGRSEAAPLVLMDQGHQAPVQQHQAGQVAPPPAQQQEKQRPELGDSQGQQQEGEADSCPVQPADLSQPQDEPQPAPAASLFAAPAEEEAFLRSLGWTDDGMHTTTNGASVS